MSVPAVCQRLFLCLGTAFLLAGCAPGEQAVQVQAVDTAMGTVIRQSIYITSDSKDSKWGEESEGENTEILTGAREVITSLEEESLSWRIPSSEIGSVNETAGNSQGMELSQKMWEYLQRIWEVSEESGGALDVTIAPAVRAWNMDAWTQNTYTLPEKEEIAKALEYTGYEKVNLESGRIFLPEGMQLDLGAVGKGIACDEILHYLQSRPEVSGAVISVGGSILTYGEKPEGEVWRVGIVNPLNTAEQIGYLSLEGQWCVSTSGDYERYVEVEGVRYHHIIDPETGYPADSGVRSVTVLCKNGMLSDALSTACFVLGTEEGIKLAEQFDAQVLIVDGQGNIHMSTGMEPYVTLKEQRVS